jgi:hypothetical protein
MSITTTSKTASMTAATTITGHEMQQVDRANATGLQPIVFVHGLWLLPSSWDRWATMFEEAGYTTLTPGWPDERTPRSVCPQDCGAGGGPFR